jgi:serine/threonine protein kinase
VAQDLDYGTLQPEDWERLGELADRFEAAWKDLPGVDLEQFLPQRDNPLRPLALQELIKTDLELRWRGGLQITLEVYSQRFPELGKLQTLPPDLIHQEYRVRQAHGDRPPLSEYRQRFPAQFPQLEQLIRQEGAGYSSLRPGSPAGRQRSGAVQVGGAPGNAAYRPADNKPAAAQTLNQAIKEATGYELIEEIGRGSFAVVWRARAPGNVPAAVKVTLRPVADEETVRELRSLERTKELAHAYLLRTHAYWLVRDRLVIAMALADQSLKARAEACREAGLPPEELFRYLREAAEAVDFLHRHQVHHCDIKPANILLLNGHVQLADLGLARVLQTDQSMTASGSGTPAYMPPEVFLGRFSPRSDQYSLAVTYAELRLRRRLFPGISLPQMLTNHLGQLPDLEPLPRAEQQAILKALAKNPNDRYENCMAFVAAVQRALRQERERGQASRSEVGPSFAQSLIRPEALPPPAPPVVLPPPRPRSRPDAEVTQPPRKAPPCPPSPTPAVSRSRRRLALLALTLTGLFALFVIWYIFLQPRPVVVPPGCEPAQGATLVNVRGSGLRGRLVGYDVYDRIVLRKGPDMPVAFVLVVPEGAEPPFYVMEQRVTRRQFFRFVREGAPAVVQEAWLPKALRACDLDLAVGGTTVAEAGLFAPWLGGELPTPKELDLTFAAGCCPDCRLGEEWVSGIGRFEGHERLGFRVVLALQPFLR